MNQDLRQLIRFLANNDMKNAQAWAKVICQKDKSKSNEDFCRRMVEHLDKQREKMMALPPNVSALLYNEEQGVMYDDELFFISSRELALEKQLLATQRSAEKLQQVGVNYRNAALMFGPSGSGKTAFAKHLARRMERDFYMVNLSTIVDSLIGGTSKNFNALFAAINQQGGKCLLFLDELDALTINRDNNGGDSATKEMGRVTMAMMQQMDMLPPSTVVLAATNHIEQIDLALRRRFPVTHRFESFSLQERIEMVQKYLTTVKRRAEERGLFTFDWDHRELEEYAEASLQVSHAKTIDTVTQSLSDMLEDNLDHLTFRALTDANGKKISVRKTDEEAAAEFDGVPVGGHPMKDF